MLNRGQIKHTFYYYSVLMFFRPLITIFTVVNEDLRFIHGVQEMIMKFCFLVLLHTMFRMKNIEIMLNLEEIEEIEVV